ncbi:LysR family transcriptional regulator [Paralcaligenes ureilyticus]|uniref:DNA-binding transcriptional LysR family regulator n=1 Tax=Paralcaligenes ureilyticus TaxID=627131 RepID=A0A4R3LV37_9BURK|nr:LysR family transcriptional regulator [Paralcaligenes ureilyticus]TCT04422.1 DNA-binding transcriptional LysR family regulator [Paralcaligenes ureilyticus]
MNSFDRQIRYFRVIAELKSLSQAAEALGLTQSGISRQLGSLEEHLGVPLFYRTGRGVELTPAGSFLQSQTHTAYETIDNALASIKGHDAATQGKLKIATVHTLSYYFMAEIVAKFLGVRPTTTVSLVARSSPEVVTLVERGDVDLGFVYDSAVASDRLNSTPLFDDRMCLIVNRQYKAKSQSIDLNKHRLSLVVFPPHYALRRMLHSSGLEFDTVAEAETIAVMLDLVSSGVGYCILPDRIHTKLLAEYSLRKIAIDQPLLTRRVVAITKIAVPPSSLTQLMLDAALGNLSR